MKIKVIKVRYIVDMNLQYYVSKGMLLILSDAKTPLKSRKSNVNIPFSKD